MKKVIRLSENDIRRMIMESINEIDYGMLHNAAEAGPEIGELTDDSKYLSSGSGDSVGYAIGIIRNALEDYSKRMSGSAMYSNKQFRAASQGIDAIERFFVRKKKQQNNLQSADSEMEDNARKESSRMFGNDGPDDLSKLSSPSQSYYKYYGY